MCAWAKLAVQLCAHRTDFTDKIGQRDGPRVDQPLIVGEARSEGGANPDTLGMIADATGPSVAGYIMGPRKPRLSKGAFVNCGMAECECAITAGAGPRLAGGTIDGKGTRREACPSHYRQEREVESG